MLPAMLINSLGDSIDLFLIGMGFNNVVLFLQSFVIPIHLFCCWFFIWHFKLDIMGAAIASNLTAFLTFICQLVYVSSKKEVSKAWYLPTRRTVMNLGPYLQLAVPGILMLFLQNMNLEILVIMAGLFNDVNILAGQVILVAFGQMIIMIPYGLSLATVTTVGNSLGANKPYEAVANCKMIAFVTTTISLAVILLMYVIRKPLISMYSSDESTEVVQIAYGSFSIFLLAFLFDATQCSASGVIKATGK